MTTEIFEEIAIEAAIGAGKAILKHYGNAISVEYKSDHSPLTLADRDADNYIQTKLAATGIPILSEESEQLHYEERKNWNLYWLVDPLDGTKEFINRRDEFTVNIALIQDTQAVFGVVYAPVADVMYIGKLNFGAFKINSASEFTSSNWKKRLGMNKMPSFQQRLPTIIAASKSHQNANTEDVINRLAVFLPEMELHNYGSSLKICKVADGAVHIYPRLGPTMEWDTAASHAVVIAAGFRFLEFPSLSAINYNKENLQNNWFIVYDSFYEEQIRQVAHDYIKSIIH